MKYRIKLGPDVITDISATDPIRKADGVIVNGRVFTAPPGWIAGVATDAIPGYAIEAYEPTPTPTPPAPTVWRVRLSVIYSRLSVPNKTEMRVFLDGNPEKAEQFREDGGVLNTNAAVRAWITNNGEDPDAVLSP